MGDNSRSQSEQSTERKERSPHGTKWGLVASKIKVAQSAGRAVNLMKESGHNDTATESEDVRRTSSGGLRERRPSVVSSLLNRVPTVSFEKVTFPSLVETIFGGSAAPETALDTPRGERSNKEDSFRREETFRSPSRDYAMKHNYGDIMFDVGTLQYCVVNEHADPEKLLKRLIKPIWNLEMPHLIVSVMGGAGNMKLDESRFNSEAFSQGLVEAAKRTGAWVITGGTQTGVMNMVGKAVKEHDRQRQVPCIGITPFGGLTPQWRKVLVQGNPCEPIDAAEIDSGLVKDERGVTLSHIQENHTHSIIIDNGKLGGAGFGGELKFRAKFEEHLSAPWVMVVVNGGMNSLTSLCNAVERGCPIVVCRGTGRIADVIAEVIEGIARGEDEDEVLDLAVREYMPLENVTPENKRVAMSIVSSHFVEIYTIGDRLEDVILRAVLTKSKSVGEFEAHTAKVEMQLAVAVQWSCPQFYSQLGAKLISAKQSATGAIHWIFEHLVPRDLHSNGNTQNVGESVGPLVEWLLDYHQRAVKSFEVTEFLGKIDCVSEWTDSTVRGLEGLLLWCVEREAHSSVLDAIWMHMDDPVHAALVASNVCRHTAMNKYTTGALHKELKKGLEDTADRFESLALTLMEDLTRRTGRSIEYLFQVSDVWQEILGGHTSCTTFRMAHMLGCHKFVSSALYTVAVDQYEMTPVPFMSNRGKHLDPSYANILLFPYLIAYGWRGTKVSSRWELFQVPCVKSWVHFISRFVFVLIYSHAVFSGVLRNGGINTLSIILLIWGFAYAKSEWRQLQNDLSFGHYISDFWNCCDVLLISALVITILLGYAEHFWTVTWGTEKPINGHHFEGVHSLNVLICWWRMFQTFYRWEYFGALIMTVIRMSADILRFSVILIILCSGFGYALTPMLFEAGDERAKQGVLWTFWSIVGETRQDLVERACGLPAPWNTVTHCLLYTLVLVTNVIAMNLLIAVMNSTYDGMKQDSNTMWAFERVNWILEYSEAGDLPPPLNLLQGFLVEAEDSEPSRGCFKRRPLRRANSDLLVHQRELKESQRRAMALVEADEDTGELSRLRQENLSLKRHIERLERLATNFLLENHERGALGVGELPLPPPPPPKTPCHSLDRAPASFA